MSLFSFLPNKNTTPETELSHVRITYLNVTEDICNVMRKHGICGDGITKSI